MSWPCDTCRREFPKAHLLHAHAWNCISYMRSFDEEPRLTPDALARAFVENRVVAEFAEQVRADAVKSSGALRALIELVKLTHHHPSTRNVYISLDGGPTVFTDRWSPRDTREVVGQMLRATAAKVKSLTSRYETCLAMPPAIRHAGARLVAVYENDSDRFAAAATRSVVVFLSTLAPDPEVAAVWCALALRREDFDRLAAETPALQEYAKHDAHLRWQLANAAAATEAVTSALLGVIRTACAGSVAAKVVATPGAATPGAATPSVSPPEPVYRTYVRAGEDRWVVKPADQVVEVLLSLAGKLLETLAERTPTHRIAADIARDYGRRPETYLTAASDKLLKLMETLTPATLKARLV